MPEKYAKKPVGSIVTLKNGTKAKIVVMPVQLQFVKKTAANEAKAVKYNKSKKSSYKEGQVVRLSNGALAKVHKDVKRPQFTSGPKQSGGKHHGSYHTGGYWF